MKKEQQKPSNDTPKENENEEEYRIIEEEENKGNLLSITKEIIAEDPTMIAKMINLRLLQKRFPKPEAPRPKPKKTTVKKSNNDQSQQPILSDDEFTIIEDEDRFDKYMK